MGDLTSARGRMAGQNSTSNGYVSGGTPPGKLDIIEKYPFATDANATDVGDLTSAREEVAGQQV